MIDAFVAVNVGLYFISVWIITGPNLHFCIRCNKFRHGSTKAKNRTSDLDRILKIVRIA